MSSDKSRSVEVAWLEWLKFQQNLRKDSVTEANVHVDVFRQSKKDLRNTFIWGVVVLAPMALFSATLFAAGIDTLTWINDDYRWIAGMVFVISGLMMMFVVWFALLFRDDVRDYRKNNYKLKQAVQKLAQKEQAYEEARDELRQFQQGKESLVAGRATYSEEEN